MYIIIRKKIAIDLRSRLSSFLLVYLSRQFVESPMRHEYEPLRLLVLPDKEERRLHDVLQVHAVLCDAEPRVSGRDAVEGGCVT